MARTDLSTTFTMSKDRFRILRFSKDCERSRGSWGAAEFGAIEPRLRPPVTPDNQFAVSDFKMFSSLMSG